jgi:hypothetical protein
MPSCSSIPIVMWMEFQFLFTVFKCLIALMAWGPAMGGYLAEAVAYLNSNSLYRSLWPTP